MHSLQEWSHLLATHPLKTKAKGLPVISVPLLLFSDDLSGNRSKKWNKFDAWYLLLAGLPRADNAHLDNIHFLTCSNRVSALEMSRPIADDLNSLDCEGLVTYDAHLKQQVLVVCPVFCCICDNPRASELTNHMGSVAKMYCRMCMVSCMLSSYISTLRCIYMSNLYGCSVTNFKNQTRYHVQGQSNKHCATLT